MRRQTHTSLHDRHQVLVQAHDDAEAEATHISREEAYLVTQIQQAEEQVRYYEGLLALLRRDWGRKPPIFELVRRLR